ncbi:MAG: DUF4328 domain-containing protein [Ilumatobacteraceae bacterium]
MSEFPTPPLPDDRPAPPPPPPPDLMAPPGYSATTASPINMVSLKRVGGLSRAVMILVVVSALASVLSLIVRQGVRDDARAFLDGTLTRADFVTAMSPYLLMSFVQGVTMLAGLILIIIWMYRMASNHRTLHRGGTWGPGWAIGGWFLPPLLYVIPLLMFRELWKASDPEVPIGGDWKSRPVSPLPTIWFVLYSLVPIGLMIAQSGNMFTGLGATEEDLAEQLTGGSGMETLAVVVTVAGAVAFIAMARELTGRHRRLTGEAAA